ncbi:hypothetical protein VTO42DRAFT_8044 [Malbranchea cinnamomea]
MSVGSTSIWRYPVAYLQSHRHDSTSLEERSMVAFYVLLKQSHSIELCVYGQFDCSAPVAGRACQRGRERGMGRLHDENSGYFAHRLGGICKNVLEDTSGLW